MDKRKRENAIGFRERLLQAKAFDHVVFTKPRHFTRDMTNVVRYPKRIYDIGRTVDVRRITEHSFAFELRQKRYLGRGSFAISARAKGIISYEDDEEKTHITGYVQLGGQYVALLVFMTLVVLFSYGLVFITILFLPIALLMTSVIGLHWAYLSGDRHDLADQLSELVNITDRELRLQLQEDTKLIGMMPEPISRDATAHSID